MSPTERAQALSDDMLDRGMVPILTHETRAIIATAIRAAENEALERAADQITGNCDAYDCSEIILALKHQEP